MKFSYKAATKDGKILKGIVDTREIKQVAVYLRSKELYPIQVTPVEGRGLANFIPFLNNTSLGDLVLFTRQLSSMITSGLTLLESLRVLKQQMQNPIMYSVVDGIIADVEEGKSFALAITKYPKTFSFIYVSLIKAAEVSGLLDTVLERLADSLEKEQELKSTIRSALLYPVIVIVGMIGVVVIMMIFVIPTLSQLYESLSIPLPLSTKIIIAISNIVIFFWPFILGFIVLLLSALHRFRKTDSGRLITDDLILKIPVFGKLIRLSILTEITRTLGLLVGSGTLVVDALGQTANIAGNMLYRNAMVDISKGVEKGVTIAEAMSVSVLFPPILTQMVKTGEQTGKLDESLLKVSEYFEREVDEAVKNLTTALEPIIIVVLGLGVGFLITSIITPIYNIISQIK